MNEAMILDQLARMERMLAELSAKVDGRLAEETVWMKQTTAAEFLGTSSQTMMRLRRRGDLHPRKVGGMWKYSSSELERYKKSNQL